MSLCPKSTPISTVLIPTVLPLTTPALLASLADRHTYGRPNQGSRTRRGGVTGLVVCLFLAGIVGIVSAPSLGAQTIKMATLSPENSPWDKIFKDMGAQWEEETKGIVKLKLYPGGVAGDEPDIIRKLKIGQYHAAAISVAGLVDIHKDFTVFEIPLFYNDFDEMKAVLDGLTPRLEKGLDEKGFKLLGWGYVGWVYFFLTESVESVEDMQALKILTLAGDETLVQWWRRNGFNPVALAATDILTGLKTGMVDAVSMPSLFAMQMQFYKTASYMADLPLAPMMGAIVISNRSWNRIKEADRWKVLAAAKEAEEKIFAQIPKLDEMAINLMKSQGLEILEIKDSEHSGEWLEAAERFANDMRGTIVPEEVFDEAAKLRAAHREKQASQEAEDE